MTTFNPIKVLAKPLFNIVVNSAAVYGAARLLGVDDSQEVALIVAIDTVFRIGIVHALSAMRLPCQETGLMGHLIFGTLTLMTQRVSTRIAIGWLGVNRRWRARAYFMTIFGYIALGWKVNGMIKDPILLCIPSLKKLN